MATLSIETGTVATVTLNRPEVRNAFNDEVIAELTQAFTQPGVIGGVIGVRVTLFLETTCLTKF